MDSHPRQPWLITILCIIGWLGVLAATVRIVIQWDTLRTLPTIHVVGAPVALAVTAVALLGYWRMRRWGLWLILTGLVARAATGLTGALPIRPADLAWPGLILIVGLIYYRRLR